MASKAKVIDATGKQLRELDLVATRFGGEVNVALMHQVVTAQLAAARSGTASTKRRSEVRGGGTKPWRQKGTGRARHGSIRSPLWEGGGVVFGPKPRDYSVKVNKKMRKAALHSALANKAEEGRIHVLEGFTEPKTKAAARCLKGAGIDGRVLMVLDPEDEGAVVIDRAFRNLEPVAFALWGALSTYDVLVADAIVFMPSALERFASGSPEAAVSTGTEGGEA